MDGRELGQMFMRGASEWNIHFENNEGIVHLGFDQRFFDYISNVEELSFDGYIFKNSDVEMVVRSNAPTISFSGSRWVGSALKCNMYSSQTSVFIEKINVEDSEISFTQINCNASEGVTLKDSVFVNSSLSMEGNLWKSSLNISDSKFLNSKKLMFDFNNKDPSSTTIKSNVIDCSDLSFGKTFLDAKDITINDCVFNEMLEVSSIKNVGNIIVKGCTFDKGVTFPSVNSTRGNVIFDDIQVCDNADFVLYGELNGELLELKDVRLNGGSVILDSSTFKYKEIEFSELSANGHGARISFAKSIIKSSVLKISNSIFGGLDFNELSLDHSSVFIMGNSIIGGEVVLDELSSINSKINFMLNDFDGSDVSCRSLKGEEFCVKFSRDYFENCYFSVLYSVFLKSNSSFIVVGCFFKTVTVDISQNLIGGGFALEGWGGVELITSFTLKLNDFQDYVILPVGEYRCIPDLRLSSFSVPPILSDIQCSSIENKSWNPFVVRTSIDREDYQKLMKLKEIAEANNDHHKVLELHAKEMRSRRWNTMNLGASLTDYLYERFSDYGQSILRPLLTQVFLIMYCSVIFHSLVINNKGAPSYIDTLMFSIANSLSVMSIQKTAQKSYITDYLSNVDYSLLYFLIGAEGLLSLPCLFLMGLALRNRFKI